MASSTASPSNVDTRTTIRRTPNNLGNGLFAASEVSVGDHVMLIKRPFVAVLDTPQLENTCAGCFGVNNDPLGNRDEHPLLKVCTGCRVVKYCHRSCQSKDWKDGHSQECAIYKRLHPRVLPNSVRAILRIVLRHDRRKDDQEEFNAFLNLETHAQDIRATNEEQWNRILLSAKAVKEYSGTNMEEAIIVTFFAKLELNTFNLTSPFHDRIGLYLHPYAAMMNHSCDYNVIVGFDGSMMFAKPIRPLKENEQVFMCYVDSTNPRDTRRKELSERYYFECDCSKCQLGYSTPEDRFAVADADLSILKSAESKARNIQSKAAEQQPLIAIQQLKSALKILQNTGIWPVSRQPSVSIRDDLILAMLSEGQWNSAFAQSAFRFMKIDPYIYPYDGHPIRHLHAYSLARLAIYIYDENLSVKMEGVVSVWSSHLNLSLIIWSLLTWILDKDQEACTSPVFRETVRRMWLSVNDEFQTKGLDPQKMVSETNKEWKKMEKIADAVLQEEENLLCI